jgi:hypothetical protein
VTEIDCDSLALLAVAAQGLLTAATENGARFPEPAGSRLAAAIAAARMALGREREHAVD